MWLADHLANQLSGPYVLPGNDDTRSFSLLLRTGVLEAGAGSAEAKLLATIDTLMAALETAD